MVEPVNELDETSSTSSEEDHEDTTLKKSEVIHTSEEPRQLNQDAIPSVCTPSSPWIYSRPRFTDHTPDRNLHPPTPKDLFRKPDEPPPPVPNRPVTPAKVPPVVTHTPVQNPPITPARKTPLHKPRYTPEHPKQPIPSKLRPIPKSDTKKPKEPFTLKVVQEYLREISNSGYTPPIMDNPINGKQDPTRQIKPSKPSKPLPIHSPHRRSYPTCYPVPDYYPTVDVEQKIPLPEEPSPKSESINVQVVAMLMIQYEQQKELEAMPPQESSNYDQVFHLGGKVGVDGGSEEPGLESELEAQHQLPPHP